jgi:predicted nucleotide-binding protein (sugar kinase/HSP70/actin superfamily)
MNSHVQHYKRPAERPFTKDQRDSTTILFGGLTYNHDYLLEGALQGMGYNAKFLPVPDNHSMSVGKEYGNRGQCNPTYYTVGNLIKYLQNLKSSSIENIDDKYVFLTAGSCGPCRFGMYEAEYRKALRDAGFPDFRILLFQQSGDMNQGKDWGLELTPKFFITLVKTIMAGDMLNELGYKIRPYEIVHGETDKCIQSGRDILYSALKEKKPLRNTLKNISKLFSDIKVDYSRIKPKVKLTGEFWAMTTEGEGNYMLQRWLESEGAEVITEPVSNWVSFIFWEHAERAKERLRVKKGAYKTILGLKAASLLFHCYYTSFRSALKFRPEPLSSQDKVAEYAKNYYNPRIAGGEGHMEIGKHIMSFREKKAHLVVSVKPFGCMPSTQSDGVQAKVVTDLGNSLFVSIETSGDSDVNVKSRVQMKLYEARERAKKEVADMLNKHNLTMNQVEEYSKRNPLSGMVRLPHQATSTTGNFIHMKAKEIR